MRAAILLAGAVALACQFPMQARAESVTFTVATNGNDKWSGKLAKPNDAKSDGPFATIERARDEIRALKRNGNLPKGGIVVEILAGRYALAQPVELTAEDSGSAESPIIYRARPGDTVHISGGRVLTDWKPVADPAVLSRLDPSARGKVFQTDLRALGITEYGDLGLDAEAQLQLWLARVDSQGEDAMGSAYASAGKKVRPRLEVFFNNQPMEISRWPNDDFIKIQEVLGKTEINVRGVKGCKEGIFVYEGDRPKRWVNEKDAWVLGYWFRDWAQQRHKITSLDTEKRIITVPPPYHQYGYRKGQWFRGFNLLCEIDEPGEWYIDREAGILYFWPPGKMDGASVEVSVAPRLLTLTDTAHVTVHGLLFETARGTAIAIKNGQHCRVVGCTFRNLGNHAVTIFDGKENGVVGCDMYGMGGGGIYLVGGDRKALIPAGHFAENNHIHHFGRWDRMYRPGIFLSGVGLRASHNLIHDAPHSAILFGGNDHLIEFNEIHNVCFESHDCGAIYAGRSWTLRGHVIQHNYLHHIYGKSGGPCNGIYLDDLFSSATVQGNIFHQVLRPVFLGGGRDNIIQNNVFVDCPKAMHIDARALGWCGPHADGRIKEAIEKGTIAGVRYKEPPFSTRYPQLVNLLDDEPKKPKGNIVRRNIFWQGTGENLRRVAKGQPIKDTWWDAIEPKIKPLVKLENNLINEDPKFVDEKAGNFQLREDSPAWKLGFQRIPVEKIGLYKDDCRACWPVKHPVRVLTAPALKVLFLGNSITRHGPKKDIGWSGNWGMAASAEEKDFAHLVAHGIGKTTGTAPEVMIKNIAEFERQYAKYDASMKLKDAFDFGADIIIIAIGENVPGLGSDEAKIQFRNSLRTLLKGLKSRNNPTLVVRSCFWANQAKDQVLKQVCQEVRGIYVDVGSLGKDESNYARSERQFSHKGVAAHPGDKGMQAIASAILGAISGQQGQSKTVSWPAPAGEALSDDYQLKVNGQPVPVHACRVSAVPFNQVWPGYQRPQDQTELAAFACWDMEQPVQVEIQSRSAVRSAVVRPTSFGIRPVIKGNRISFSLDRPRPVVVEVNGTHHALHLFACPPEKDAPAPNTPGVRFFGPGVHRPGRIELKSNETVYLAGGAVVYGSIHASNATNIFISGRGVLDVGPFERGQGGGAIRLQGCSNVTVEGIVMRDPDVWCCSLFGCSKVTISNVKLVGLWRYNADGIDVCNSQDVTVRDCFVRAFDDALVVKGLKSADNDRPVRNIRFSRCVVWCDWGRALEIGAETCAPEIAGVAFEDCDVVRTTHIAMDIQHGDRAAVRDIRFEGIRVEIDGQNPCPKLQKSREEEYRVPDQNKFCPSLMVIVIRKTPYSKDATQGVVREIVFKDISLFSNLQPPSSFRGLDAEHNVEGVTIQNLRFNGRPIRDAAGACLTIGPHVGGVQFLEKGTNK